MVMLNLSPSEWPAYTAWIARLEPLPPLQRRAKLESAAAAGQLSPALLALLQSYESSPPALWPPEAGRCRTGEWIHDDRDRTRRYRLEDKLGTGGMGEVYRATEQCDNGFTRPVAVKLIRPDWLRKGSSNAVEQFRHEIATLAKVEHAHIVRLYTGGLYTETTGDKKVELPFMVMQYVDDGRPLTVYAEQEGYTVPQRLALFCHVCEGVKAMHEGDIVLLHRDLKPTNILVNSKGHPFIVDFGLAWVYDATGQGEDAGSFAGTPAYMSPEQATHAPLHPRSDVYTLGVILYELLTGQRPYQTIEQVSLVPPSAHNPKCPSPLDRIVTKALATRPTQRYQTVAALQNALRTYLEQRGEGWRLYREDAEPVDAPQPVSAASAYALSQFPDSRRRSFLRRLPDLIRFTSTRWRRQRVPKDSYQAALAILPRIEPQELFPCIEPQVRYADTPDDLRVISQLEAVEYGAHSIDAGGLRGWWECYPKGVHLVEMGMEIVGALGLWPIADRVFDAMIRGTMEETQLGGHPDDIAGAPGAYPSWYVGDIIVHPDYRHREPHVLMTLLYVAVTRWCHSGELAPTVKICAFGFTDHGRQFLTHFGFRRDGLPSSPLGYPIYQLRAARAALQAALPRVLEPLRATTLAHPEE